MTDSFPRQHARTQRYTLGEPRNVTVAPDGSRIVFLRSGAGDDPVNALWVLDVESGDERQVADPRRLLGTDDVGAAGLTDEERARRERTRDSSSGITAYATDADAKVVAFEIAGRLFVGGLLSGLARPMDVPGPVFDPRPDPTASRLAYVCGATLRIAELDGTTRAIAGGDGRDPATVTWGRADFVAAEEMHRFRGFWWSPDGETIVACRVDEAPVDEWTIADPASPSSPARTIRYPAAGTANAEVTLHLLRLDGSRVAVDWDREFFPYVARVDWSEHGLIFSAQSRDQRSSIVVRVDTTTGEGEVIGSDYDDVWVENVPGVPALLPDGRLLTASDRDGCRRLFVDDDAVTPDHLQVRSVAHVGEHGIVFVANDLDEPTEAHVWVADGTDCTAITESPGVHAAIGGGDTLVVRSTSMERAGAVHTVRRGLLDAGEHAGDDDDLVITSHAEHPVLSTSPTLLRAGERGLATAVFLPDGHDPERDGSLPVLLDPYGGPHAQRVTKAYNSHLTSQWFADQGFAVIVVDGRGTPGRGAEFERAVHLDLAIPPLDDQVAALHSVAEQFDGLDLDRVAIRGWSFGGYLAALAVLERPDVFHAAIAGAPVTEWRLYDTHYTERYLGDPTTTSPHDGGAVYDHNSLLSRAAGLRRPLLLVHGLADDNVVAAHTLQLSSALLAAGRPHEVLPLAGVSHMTAPQEVVAENLLLHQLDFLSRALGLDLESSEPPSHDSTMEPR